MNTIRWRKSTHSGPNGNCVELALGWCKSTHSNPNGSCVELALDWRKSSRSNPNGDCVELAHVGLVRDSKNSHGPVLPADIPALVAAVKAGLLDH